MQRRLAVPVGVVGLLLFVALGWYLSDGPGPGAPTPKAGWVSFDEGLRLSKEQNKKMLVDVYTEWCTWCKKMDADTYPDPLVVKELQAHYITVKLNAESDDPVTFNGERMTSSQFAQAAGVTGYPTTLFLDEQQNPITVVPGYAPPERFVQILRYFSGDHHKRIDFQSYLNQSGG